MTLSKLQACRRRPCRAAASPAGRMAAGWRGGAPAMLPAARTASRRCLAGFRPADGSGGRLSDRSGGGRARRRHLGGGLGKSTWYSDISAAQPAVAATLCSDSLRGRFLAGGRGYCGIAFNTCPRFVVCRPPSSVACTPFPNPGPQAPLRPLRGNLRISVNGHLTMTPDICAAALL